MKVEQAIIQNLNIENEVDSLVGNNTRIVNVTYNWRDTRTIKKLMYLHDFPIAFFEKHGNYYRVKVSDCGCQTKTTKSRLNTFLAWFEEFLKLEGVPCVAKHFVYQENKQWYLYMGGTPINNNNAQVINFDEAKQNGYITIEYYRF